MTNTEMVQPYRDALALLRRYQDQRRLERGLYPCLKPMRHYNAWQSDGSRFELRVRHNIKNFFDMTAVLNQREYALRDWQSGKTPINFSRIKADLIHRAVLDLVPDYRGPINRYPQHVHELCLAGFSFPDAARRALELCIQEDSEPEEDETIPIAGQLRLDFQAPKPPQPPQKKAPKVVSIDSERWRASWR